MQAKAQEPEQGQEPEQEQEASAEDVAAVLEAAGRKAAALLQWRVEVTLTAASGAGTGEVKRGLVTDTRKRRMGKPTLHVIQFDDGTEASLLLDRKNDQKKEKCPFRPLRKMG